MSNATIPINRDGLHADASDRDLTPLSWPRDRLDPESMSLSEEAEEYDEYLTTQRPDRFETV